MIKSVWTQKVSSQKFLISSLNYTLNESIRYHIPENDLAFKKLCDVELNMKEPDTAIKQIAVGKAPGSDGITQNFLKVF